MTNEEKLEVFYFILMTPCQTCGRKNNTDQQCGGCREKKRMMDLVNDKRGK